MAIPVPGEGRRGLVSVRLFGFPVTIHLSFVLVILFLHFSARGDAIAALVWLAVVTVSVVAHELGHAFVAAPTGGEPRIDLYMMAGLTTWQPGRASRLRRVAVSFAGPAAGVVFGLLVAFAYAAIDPVRGSRLDEAFLEAIYVNLAWGLLNLLPMLPLDGGQIVLALMPGRDEQKRLTRASYVSLAVAAVVAVAAVAVREPFAAILVIFFGAGNLQRLVALHSGTRDDDDALRIRVAIRALDDNRPADVLRVLDGPVPQPLHALATMFTAAAFLRLGRPRDAQDSLLLLPPGSVDPVLEGAVLIANGQDRLGRERLATALAHDPSDWAVRELVLLLRRRGEDVVGTVGHLTGSGAAGVAAGLFHSGDFDAAAAWGERALATGATHPSVAYNAACAHARAGDAERALRALAYAAELGWTDVDAADHDEDVAAARALPGWPEVRARMLANPGSRGSHAAR